MKIRVKYKTEIEFGDGKLYIENDKSAVTASIENKDGDTVFNVYAKESADIVKELNDLKEAINLALATFQGIEENEGGNEDK